MQFKLDELLIDEIIFYMENQDSDFLLDTEKSQIIDINNNDYTEEPDFDNDERFITLPEWTSNDGYRLMEKFASALKNPVVREELAAALNRNKGVFRSFRETLEQYPEAEKMWFKFKEQKMKDEVISWYNSLKEEWKLEPAGIEPEDNSSLIMEDFIIREGKKSDSENVFALHKLCIEEKNENISLIYKTMNPFNFPGDFSFVGENANEEFTGYICAEKSASGLQITQLEVKPEYRGMGLGKALLNKLLEKAQAQGLPITIDLPADIEYFSRSLHLEGFKPCVKRFIFENK